MKGTKKMISGGANTSRKLARVTIGAEFVYWRVYLASDNYGTMVADPWDVLQLAMPAKNGATEEFVGGAIDQLVDVKLLERWTFSGVAWIHVANHERHQSADFKRKRGRRKSAVPPSQGGPIDDKGAPEPPKIDSRRPNGAPIHIPGAPNAVSGAPSTSRSSTSYEVPALAQLPTGFPLLLEVDRQERHDRHADRFETAGSARAELEEIPWGERGERLHVTEDCGQSDSGPGGSAAAASGDALGGVA